MEATEQNALGGLVVAFLAGAAVGAAVAILTTPKSGPEMRGALTGLGKEFTGKIRKKVEEMANASLEDLEAEG